MDWWNNDREVRHQWPFAERRRREAEKHEGISHESDADGYGFLRKPFGTGYTGAGILRWLKRPR